MLKKPSELPSQISTISTFNTFINVKHTLISEKFLAQLRSLKINKRLISPRGGRKIQKSISFPSCIKYPRVSIGLCLTPVGKTFYEKLTVKSKEFYSNQF